MHSRQTHKHARTHAHTILVTVLVYQFPIYLIVRYIKMRPNRNEPNPCPPSLTSRCIVHKPFTCQIYQNTRTIISFRPILSGLYSNKYVFFRRSLEVQIVTVFSKLPLSNFFLHGSTAPSGPGLPHSRGFRITVRHTHSVGLLWKSDQPVAETSTWQNTPLTRDKHPWDSNTQLLQLAAGDPPISPLCSYFCLFSNPSLWLYRQYTKRMMHVKLHIICL